jgi:hydrogenase-1 operon protein HyaF
VGADLSRLTEIPIRIEPAARRELPPKIGGLGGGVTAILSELVRLLEGVARGEPPASIDLRSLPMSPEDRTHLQLLLGEGEVRASVNALGVSRIRETQVTGVWWVEHFDRGDELLAESIEVARVPEILMCALDEIAAAAINLRKRIENKGSAERTETHVGQ